ncbi:MAG: hypothetical protein E7614_07140 [Ruminococcaceae bacterium]|nr:hypothetical protein [Oscillospiraceae bacterium]
MKKSKVSLKIAIFLFTVGMILGTVFIFGMGYWNSNVTREECIEVKTHFLSYKEIKQQRRFNRIKQFAVDCTNGERYFIDGVSINAEVSQMLSQLSEKQPITLLIHPNSNTIVEFSTKSISILEFNDTMKKLRTENTAFLFLGIFMYICMVVGLYYIVLHYVQKRKYKKNSAY